VFTVIQTDRGASDRVTEDAVFEASGLDISFLQYECESEDDLIEFCAQADALMPAYAPLTARVLDRLPSCVIVAFMATGFNSVDMTAATARGIVVTNVPDYCTAEVADHTMGFLLDPGATSQAEPEAGRDSGSWRRGPAGASASKACIIGLGRIGSAVAGRAGAFGWSCAHDPCVDEGT
jgi:D-3-phosphoglycerate dehydrogenase